MNNYELGYRDGYRDAMNGARFNPEGTETWNVNVGSLPKAMRNEMLAEGVISSKRKRKVKQSPKQKLLTQMTKVKWNKYKKGSGKKTYVQIRAEVSRSQLFKRKAKRL